MAKPIVQKLIMSKTKVIKTYMEKLNMAKL
jgi:hypothetical protein